MMAVFIAALSYVVLVPLLIMLHETFIVHPLERFQVPGSVPGDYTMSHWQRIFVSENSYAFLYKPLLNTLLISISLAVASLSIGGLLAWLVVRTNLPFKKFISNIAIVPYIMPSWTLALAWIVLFKNPRLGGTQGVFQYMTGIAPPDWFSYGLVPITICLALHYFPFGFMLIGAALKNIDSQLEESAELLGARRGLVLRKIVFPLVLPAIFSTFLLTFAKGLGTFGTPAFLGGPVREYVLSTILYANLVGQRPGMGYLIALVLIIFGALVLYMNQKFIGARRSFVTISGKGARERMVDLGVWKYVIGGALVLFLVMVTVVPFTALAIDTVMLRPGIYNLQNFTLHYWIGEPSNTIGLGTGQWGILRNPAILDALWNSLRLGVVVALICGVLGMLIGYTVVRTRGTFMSKLLDQMSFAPYLIPSIAFGSICLVLFAVQRGPIPSLYGTFALLVIACVAMYLPYASRAGIGAMMQIGPELEEAAIMGGAGWFRRIGKIVLPLQKSAFFSALILPFISAMRELSLIVLLVSPGNQLATSITIGYTERGWYPYTNGVVVLIVVTVLTATILSQRIFKTDLAKGIGG